MSFAATPSTPSKKLSRPETLETETRANFVPVQRAARRFGRALPTAHTTPLPRSVTSRNLALVQGEEAGKMSHAGSANTEALAQGGPPKTVRTASAARKGRVRRTATIVMASGGPR